MGISPTEGSGVTLGECDCTAMGGGVERGRLELELNFVNRFSTDFFNGTCTYTNNVSSIIHTLSLCRTPIFNILKSTKKHSKTTLKALEMHNTHILHIHVHVHVYIRRTL